MNGPICGVGAPNARPMLSVCIATRNRGMYIGQTLDSILAQCGPNVEIAIVDGASTDNTGEIVAARVAAGSNVKYFPQDSNSGVDGDFDKAIQLASGRYCWLMSDDDLLAPAALERVLRACDQDPDAIIVDAEVCTADFSEVLVTRRLPFRGERRYGVSESDRLLAECGRHLTFIGALVIRRDLWLARERAPYSGTEFIHVGVLFQAPLNGMVIAIGEPLLRMRYGVGNWSPRAFQVWMFKWPALIWSFEWIGVAARASVCARKPWQSPRALLLYRAKGWFSWTEFRRFIVPEVGFAWQGWLPALIALLPGQLVNLVVVAFAWACRNERRGGYYDLRRSPYFIWKWRE